MEARVADIAAHQAPRTGLAAGTPPALHLRHQRQGRRPARSPLPDVCHRARRAAHLSRPRPAGGLCDARPEAAAARRAGLCGRPRGVDHPDAGRLQCARRAARGSRRRLGAAGRTRAKASKTRSPPSACGCGAGCRSTASPSMWSPISRISTRIVPCGVADPRYGVTSLVDLGHPVTMADVDVALRQAFAEVFGAGARRGCRKRRV